MIELPDNPITYSDGRPVAWFGQLLRKLSTTVDGVLSFIGYVPGQVLTIDGIEQGINSRVREIATEIITRGDDDLITQVDYRDPTTDVVIARETFAYNADQTVAQRTQTTAQAVVTEDFIYVNGSVVEIRPAILAAISQITF